MHCNQCRGTGQLTWCGQIHSCPNCEGTGIVDGSIFDTSWQEDGLNAVSGQWQESRFSADYEPDFGDDTLRAERDESFARQLLTLLHDDDFTLSAGGNQD